MTELSPEFGGLTALVTGGASGIGLAAARLLAARGARVAVLDRVKANPHNKANQETSNLYPVIADVTDDATVRAAIGEVTRALGRLDILVNNAGIGAAGTVEDNDDEHGPGRGRRHARSAHATETSLDGSTSRRDRMT